MKQSIKYVLILCFLAFFLNIFFLWRNYKKGEYCFGTLVEHGEVAYNLCHFNSLKINPKRVSLIGNLQMQQEKIVDYVDIDHQSFGMPDKQRDIGDTIGYGVVLGLLWKLTRSLRYLDMQILQIIIFSFLMILVYQLAFLLFDDRKLAFWCGIALLSFFPLIFQNIQAHRDIWAYYGTIILAYSVLKFLKKGGVPSLALSALAFSLVQWVRPLIFTAFLGMVIFLLGYGFFYRKYLKKVLFCIMMFCVMNIFFFWIPFVAFNMWAYDQPFVAPVGHDLLHGLGEFPNKWGYQLDDGWYHRFMKGKYPHLSRLEYDAYAKQIFYQSISEDPLFYVISLAKRFVGMLFPNLPWSHYYSSLYESCNGVIDKIRLSFHKAEIFSDFWPRLLYMRFFLLMGYLGILLAFFRKKYFIILFFMMGIWSGSFAKFLSHIEYRYIVSFYWPFAFFVAYLMYEMMKKKRFFVKR